MNRPSVHDDLPQRPQPSGSRRRPRALTLASVTALVTMTACTRPLTGPPGRHSRGTAGTDPASLAFPIDAYTVETKTVPTSAGDRSVTYHSYVGIPYVSRPVDPHFQSLKVSVPVEIDGHTVDATAAPILFDITIGGYLSSAAGTGAAAGPPGGGSPGGGAPPAGFAGQTGAGNADLALAAGLVVVTPSARGRDNVRDDGTYYGKAPAAVVDLKAALRYVHANKGVLPGDTDRIVTNGTSAGGALSALVGASAGSHRYDPYLDALGAARASDDVFAVAAYCPIADIEHADAAYEWMFGTVPMAAGPVDQALSASLRVAFSDYQASLHLPDTGRPGELTAGTYADHLLRMYLQPAATRYLTALPDGERQGYLAANPWITWANGTATFAFADFLTHVGRLKGLPAFDSFDLSSPENILFGNETTDARHFTDFTLRHATGNDTAQIDPDLRPATELMNPMGFLQSRNPARARHWWLRVGTSDTHTSLTVLGNLAASARNAGDDVNALMYWDADHGANQDADDFIQWIGGLTR